MGYDIYWHGSAEITPALKSEDARALQFLFDFERKLKDVFLEQPPLPEELDFPEESGVFMLNGDSLIEAEGDQTRWYSSDMEEWWKQLLKLFFVPRGYHVSGAFCWSGSEENGTGSLFVEGSQAEAVEDTTDNAGPSWANWTGTPENMRAVLEEFVKDVKAAYSRTELKEDWPDLLVTYDKAKKALA
jgi:hypothetical protein